jgi:3-phosphoshikimate 1-carboxyvinyltransferase
MTLELLNQIGVKTSFEGNSISVDHKSSVKNHELLIESDWSSASYFYSIVALSEIGTEITLSSYKKNSLQGDAILIDIYKNFGVKTMFNANTITLVKTEELEQKSCNFQLNNSPDIAQTIAVTCFGLGIGCHLTGLHTLKIKETDRLLALKTELQKLGAIVEITEDSLFLKASNTIENNVVVSTYNDHRMAMAFAPLALKSSLKVEDAMVVSKSYPTFWDDLKAIGFKIKQ